MRLCKKILPFFFLGLMACSSTPGVPEPQMPLMSESDYDHLIETNSTEVKIYDGFTNILTVNGTLLNAAVTMAQLDQTARMYQWSLEQYNQERAKAQEKLGKETRVFISFYTPERKHDDLQKTNSHWKLFLDVDGHRYEGTATRWKSILVEVRAFYPYHSRWGTPYLITFPVPETQVEGKPAKLTLTGPVGAAQLEFTPKK